MLFWFSGPQAVIFLMFLLFPSEGPRISLAFMFRRLSSQGRRGIRILSILDINDLYFSYKNVQELNHMGKIISNLVIIESMKGRESSSYFSFECI